MLWLALIAAQAADIRVGPDFGDYLTIGEAIAAASSGDRLFLENGPFTESVVVDKDLSFYAVSLNGPRWVADSSGPALDIQDGASVLVNGLNLYGAGSQRAIDVHAASQLTMRGSRITTGSEYGAYGDGGMVWVDGELHLIDTVLDGSGRAARGGAIFGTSGSMIRLDENSLISNARARDEGGCIYSEGKLYMQGGATLRDCTLTTTDSLAVATNGGALLKMNQGTFYGVNANLEATVGGPSVALASETDVAFVNTEIHANLMTLSGVTFFQEGAYVDWAESWVTDGGWYQKRPSEGAIRHSKFCNSEVELNLTPLRNSTLNGVVLRANSPQPLQHLRWIDSTVSLNDASSFIVNSVAEGTGSWDGVARYLDGLFPSLPYGNLSGAYPEIGTSGWAADNCYGTMFTSYPFTDPVVNAGISLTSLRVSNSDLDGSAPDLGPMGGPWSDASRTRDADGDGFGAHLDCNDEDPAVHPLAPEVCDGIDNDCNPATVDGDPQNWFSDADGDGYPSMESIVGVSCTEIVGATTLAIADCAINDPARYPGAEELCDGIDNDCDGLIDPDENTQTWFFDGDGDGYGAGAPVVQCGSPGPDYVTNDLDCDDSVVGRQATEWAPDHDGDGAGHKWASTVESCAQPVGTSYGPNTDCDDTRPDVLEGVAELCNYVDDDCDGLVDEGLAVVLLFADNDGDGIGFLARELQGCDPGPGSFYSATGGDCRDDRSDIAPGVTEICDGEDNDCDGTIDEGLAFEHWVDFDRDGYSDSRSLMACPFGYEYTLTPTAELDCDDTDPYISPLAPDDDCDLFDDDCDGVVDEDPNERGSSQLHRDDDGDNYGTAETDFFCNDNIPGWALLTGDCDDNDAAIFPTATELCDGIDNDCNAVVDDGALVFETYYDDVDGDGLGGAAHVQCMIGAGQVTTPGDCHDGDPNVGLPVNWYRDADADSYGNPDNTVINCFPGAGWVGDSTDCDDTAADVYPLATETCDGRDEDCDLTTDEDLGNSVFYADDDGDGYGGAAVVACSVGLNVVDVAGDCDDAVATVYPDATEFCGDGIDQDCDGSDEVCDPIDDDGDGFCGGGCTDGSQPGDCNDDDPAINPWASEVCDAVDNDCDGLVDEGLTADVDGDGFTEVGSCTGLANDCNDFLVDVFPGASEACNGMDDDCDGAVDEDLVIDADGDGFPAPGCGLLNVAVDCDDANANVFPGNEEVANNGVDDDCDGSDDEDPSSDDDDGDGYCEGPVCTGTGILPGDCDDTDPAINPGPSAVEVVDGIDNDCDGVIDDGVTSVLDRDGDGFTIAEGDCNDLDEGTHPGAAERCNGLDDNCDGYLPVGEIDQDGDMMMPCEGDCDDTRANVRPGLAEDCTDGLDNNCSGEADEDSDYDLDGYTTCGGDCADLDPLVNPGADEESCNQLDDDCDGTVDEGLDADQDGVIACTVSQLEGGCVPDLVVCDCDDNSKLVAPGLAEICGDGLDNDCDGFVDNDEDLDGDGFRTCQGDCDDGNPFVSPGTPETCDGKDNDCDLAVDETFDQDNDGWLTCRGDCDDTLAETFPFNEELCDLSDNDCNTVVDDPWPDLDEDGYTECTEVVDCDPRDPDIGPDIAEVCGDSIDNDCDGAVDWADTDCVAEVFPSYCGSCNSTGSAAFGWVLLLPIALLRRREVAA